MAAEPAAPATPTALPGFNARLARRFAAIARPYWRESDSAGAPSACWRRCCCPGPDRLQRAVQPGDGRVYLGPGRARRAALLAAIRRFTVILRRWRCRSTLYYFVRDTLALRWRRWLTARFLGRYLADHAYYRLNAVAAPDNPDQRISEDINAFTGQSLYFSMIVLGALIEMAAFAGVPWAISPPLIYILCGYAAAATAFTATAFGRRLIGLNFAQPQREADLRPRGCARTPRPSPCTTASRASARCCCACSTRPT
ncbi:MAG: hypothetical protein U1F53_15260 [Burkholderiaceae bacterium]